MQRKKKKKKKKAGLVVEWDAVASKQDSSTCGALGWAPTSSAFAPTPKGTHWRSNDTKSDPGGPR